MPARDSYSASTASKIRSYIRNNPGLRAKDIADGVGLRRETVNSYLYSRQENGLASEVAQDGNYGWHLKSATGSRSTRQSPSPRPSTPQPPRSNTSSTAQGNSRIPQRDYFTKPAESSSSTSDQDGSRSTVYRSDSNRAAPNYWREEVRPPKPATPEEPPKYSPEVIKNVFNRDDYQTLKEEEQGKLAEMLAAAERERLMIEKKAEELVEQRVKELARQRRGVTTWVWVLTSAAVASVVSTAVLNTSRQPAPNQPTPIEKGTNR